MLRQKALLLRSLALVVALLLVTTSCGQPVDEAFPPGNPVMEQPGDNPVLGSEGPGVIVETDTTNYGLLALIALALIGSGIVLVLAGRWADRRAA